LDQWTARFSKSGGLLPKTKPLPGSLHAQFRRCGKANCRCAGGELHGPYFRRHWWSKGRQHWRYVRPSQVAEVRAGLARWRELHPPSWKMRQMIRELFRLADQEFGP